MGGLDKLALPVAGTTLLDRALASVDHVDAVVVVGPVRATTSPVTWTRETPPGSGPVAAIAAGLRTLEGEPVDHAIKQPGEQEPTGVILVLAGDMPLVRGAFAGLLEALMTGPWDVALGVDELGVDQPLLAAWRTEALAGALERLQTVNGARVRDLLVDVRVNRVEVGMAALDCDDEADFNRATDALQSLE